MIAEVLPSVALSVGLLLNAVTCLAPAPGSASPEVQPEVVPLVGMARGAVGLAAAVVAYDASADVLLARHGFEVVRVAAAALPTEVVEFETGWDGPAEVLVRYSMRASVLVVAIAEDAVSVDGDHADPKPAARVRFDVKPRLELGEFISFHAMFDNLSSQVFQ